jgi:hypothetical protein
MAEANQAGDSSMTVSTKVDTCYYLTRADRPGCQGIAVMSYGSVALCASCDSRRSTIGKGVARHHLKTPTIDPLEQLSAAQNKLDQASQKLVERVILARRTGCSWTRIAQVVGTTRQAAQQRYGGII